MPPARKKRSKGLSRNPDADPVKVHEDFVRQRIGGGARPTAEAYQRAIEDWHKLSGAIRRPATETTGPDGFPSQRGPDLGVGPVPADVALDSDSADQEQ